jgi:predicted nucleic acid-binding protein
LTPVLVDTNILVYAHDAGEKQKQARALGVLHRLNALNTARLSVQCLAEFFSVVRQGAKPRLSLAEATVQLERFARAWPILELTASIVLEATRGVRQHQLSYWDAQIWASARLNQIPVIFSEDFQDRQTMEGVTFVNPLADTFSPDMWT